MSRKSIKLLRQTFKLTGASRIFSFYFFFFFLTSVLLWIIDPAIETLNDSIWYCFAAVTTIGFGDVAVTRLASRILTIVMSVYSIAVTAIFTAVVTSFFLEKAKARRNESIQEFLDDLEHLPELSPEELKAISEKIKSLHESRSSQ